MEIIADYREKRIILELSKKGIDVKSKSLISADFIINSIRGMLSAIAIDLQIPTLYTKNEKDTASYIETIAKRIESKRKDISLLKKRKPLELTELQEYIIESFPGIGPTIAKNLLKKFKTVKKIVNAEEKELLEVEKLGKKKVKEIKRVLEEDYKLRT